MNFDRVDAHGLSLNEKVDLVLKTTQDTHECVHRIEDETRRSIHGISGQIGDMRVRQDVTEAMVIKLGKIFGAEAVEKGEKVSKGIGAMPLWKAALAGLGVLSGAVLAYQIAVPVLAAFHQALLSAAAG